MIVILLSLLVYPVFSQEPFNYESCRGNNPNRTSLERLNCARYISEIRFNRERGNTRHKRSTYEFKKIPDQGKYEYKVVNDIEDKLSWDFKIPDQSKYEYKVVNDIEDKLSWDFKIPDSKLINPLKPAINNINDKSLESEFSDLYTRYYYTKDKAISRDLVSRVNGLAWNKKVEDVNSFLIILWKISELLKLMQVYEPEQIKTTLLTHEIIFSNMFHWDIINMDYIFYLFFVMYRDASVKYETENIQLGDRIKETVTSYYKLIKSNRAWDQTNLDYYFYVLFNRNLQTPVEIVTEKVTKESIIPFKQQVCYDNLKLTVYSQSKLDETYVNSTLFHVYKRFKMLFQPLVEKKTNSLLYVDFHVFDNKSEYNKHASFFGFTTNNGGISYSTTSQGSYATFCYVNEGRVLNFGHEFVHSLVYFFFKDSHKFTDFIHEGLAEVIGQERLHKNEIENTKEINLNLSLKSNYETETSPYTTGFIVFHTLLKTNCDLIYVLEPYNEDAFYRLVNWKKNEYIYNKDRFFETYIEPASLVNQTSVFHKYYPGDLRLVIDRTYFEFINGYIYKYHDVMQKYPVLDSGNGDFRYLITFVMKTSIKKIRNYKTVFPKIAQMKESVQILAKSKDKSLEDIFNSFFLIGNELDYGYLDTPGKFTYTTIKELVQEKSLSKGFEEVIVPKMDLSKNEYKLIYDLNTAKVIDMESVRQVPANKPLDVLNRSIIPLFSSFFPADVYYDKKAVSVYRNSNNFFDLRNKAAYEVKQYDMSLVNGRVDKCNPGLELIINMMKRIVNEQSSVIKRLQYIQNGNTKNMLIQK